MTGAAYHRVIRVLFIVYFLEAGMFLVMAPWSRFWNSRLLSSAPDWIASVLASPFSRGFITGLGLLHVAAAITDIELWRRENAQRVPDSPQAKTEEY